jgi:hypothetical protein
MGTLFLVGFRNLLYSFRILCCRMYIFILFANYIPTLFTSIILFVSIFVFIPMLALIIGLKRIVLQFVSVNI